MVNPEKAKRTKTGELLYAACKCNDCDANACPHGIKIRKHDCLHLEDNVDYNKIPTRKASSVKSKGSHSNSSRASSSKQVRCSKPIKKKCCKKDKVDKNMLGLLDGLDREGCCCEVVARAIADNPRRMGLATLRESVNEGKLASPPKTSEANDAHPT